MKESKLLVYPLISLSLLLVSFVLLSFWGYQIFYKSKNKNKTEVTTKDSASLINRTRDSLQKMYNATIGTLDNHISIPVNRSDSFKANVDIKPDDFYKLRNEISDLLKNPVTINDLQITREKINELQQSIRELHLRNSQIEAENKKLNSDLQQLLNKKEREQNGLTTSENKFVSPKTRNTLVTIKDLHLLAIDVNENREIETTLAERTGKFVGYFTLKNNNIYNDPEIFIVVIQPDGHILKKSDWDAGTFETSGGTKTYSCKINLDDNRKEAMQLEFSLTAENFQRGNFTVQIYYNKLLVGKTVKTLL